MILKKDLSDGKKLNIAVGLSGGVDSSCTAALLAKAGHSVTGVHMRCWDYDSPGCRGNEDRSDAIKTASLLGILFVDLNFEKEYREKVVGYFFDELKKGRTPNPDVMCNKEIKFGLFLDWALREGFDHIATGHYARVEEIVCKNGKKEFNLFSGKDASKDQSYFLYKLDQRALSKSLFPLGDYRKNEIREMAKEFGIQVWNKPDSTGICFIGDINVTEFIKANIKVKKGKVLDTKGEVVGEHDGIELYTIGQRHGFTTTKYSGLPMYVISKNAKENTLIVGFGDEAQTKNFMVEDVNFISPSDKFCKDEKFNCLVRIRNLGEDMQCEVVKAGKDVKEKESQQNTYEVHLSDYTKGVAPGQSAVFYEQERVIGGGVISSSAV